MRCGEIRYTGKRQDRTAQLRKGSFQETTSRAYGKTFHTRGAQYINKAIFPPGRVSLAIPQGPRREKIAAAGARERYRQQLWLQHRSCGAGATLTACSLSLKAFLYLWHPLQSNLLRDLKSLSTYTDLLHTFWKSTLCHFWQLC